MRDNCWLDSVIALFGAGYMVQDKESRQKSVWKKSLKFLDMSQENNNDSSVVGAASRANNIQKINDRKQKIFNLPKSSKIFKISTYSNCQNNVRKN